MTRPARHHLARWSSRPTPREVAETLQAWIEAQPVPTTRTRALTAMLKARGLWREPKLREEPNRFADGRPAACEATPQNNTLRAADHRRRQRAFTHGERA
jgi:hypothetical protein